MPTNAFGVAVVLLLVLPGVVWAATRSAMRGLLPQDKDVPTRLLQAIVVSAVLDAVYLLAFGPWVMDQVRSAAAGRVSDPRGAAAALLLLGVAAPAALAYLLHARPRLRRRPDGRGLRRFHVHRRVTGYEATPTAWDKAAPGLGGHWVRVRLAPGHWVGGWYGGQSFVSTYPEPRDLYIEDQHHMSKSGDFGDAVEGSAGVWLALSGNEVVVEWIKP